MGIADAPIWVSGLIMGVAFPLMVEGGFRLHRLFGPSGSGAGGGAGFGQIVSAALALLGLLIGFTFAMAAERYETRRVLVVQEANAISTADLRYHLLQSPYRDRLRGLMQDYVMAREAFVDAGLDPQRLDGVDARTAVLQERIWDQAGEALAAPVNAPLTTPVLQATNEMFDLAASRRAALEARVPQGVLLTVAVFALATALIIGYSLAAEGRRYALASSGLFVLVALAVTLIIDLDQPRDGAVTINQTPLDRVAAGILHPHR